MSDIPNSPRPDFICVEDYNFFYSENQVLFDVNMEIPERQVTALIGPSA